MSPFQNIKNLPTQDHNEIHDIPSIPQIWALVENKSQSNDFNASFKTEDPNEVGFCLLLQGGNKWTG